MRAKQFLRLCLFLLLAGVLITHIAAAQETSTATGFEPITVENVSQLELGYALPGLCLSFSHDGNMVGVGQNWMTSGVYDVQTGQRLFITSGALGMEFSADDRLFAVSGSGVYDSVTGELLFPSIGGINFSPDGRFISVNGDSVYETDTWEQTFPIRDNGRFNPESTMIAVWADGVYDIATGQQLFSIPYVDDFNLDSSLMTVRFEGVYSAETGQILFSTDEDISLFSPYGTYVATQSSVYVASSGNRVFHSDESWVITFSLDEAMMLAEYYENNRVYDTSSWELKFTFDSTPISDAFTTDIGTDFSDDGSLVSLAAYGIYDTATGEKLSDLSGWFHAADRLLATHLALSLNEGVSPSCLLYGVQGNNWAYRSGLVTTDIAISLYSSPNGEFYSQVSGTLPVFARTADNEWLRVDYEKWIAAADVEIIFMPDGVPVENP